MLLCYYLNFDLTTVFGLMVYFCPGTMLKVTIKQDKAPVFEMEKCDPKYFIQKILPKQATIRSEEGALKTGKRITFSVFHCTFCIFMFTFPKEKKSKLGFPFT